MIESADAQTQAVLKEYPTLIEVRPPRPNTAVVPNLAPFFRQKHEANVAMAKKGEADLLFMGDSITDVWRNDEGPFAGKKVLDWCSCIGTAIAFSKSENSASGHFSSGHSQ